jgi:DNA-binding HxlR family transcriptional regulator
MVDEAVAGNPEAYNRITEILGCKWSLAIFDALGRGINRPGRIEKEYEGLTTKALHRCLNRLEQDGVLQKTVFAEVPPHVEYALTENGRKLVSVLSAVRDLSGQWGTDISSAACTP